MCFESLKFTLYNNPSWVVRVTTEYVQTSFNSTEFNLIGSNYNYTCSGRVCWGIIECSYSSKIGSDCRILIVLNGSD